jgi:hypothetical protein
VTGVQIQPTATGWPCPLCGRSHQHARFLITHLDRMHGVNGANSQAVRIALAVEAEGDELEWAG